MPPAGVAAAFWGHLDILESLLDAGADVSIADNDGNCAVTSAVLGNHPQVLALLLEKGGDPNCRNRFGITPVDLAKKKGRKNLLRLLEQSHSRSATTTISD